MDLAVARAGTGHRLDAIDKIIEYAISRDVDNSVESGLHTPLFFIFPSGCNVRQYV